MYIFSHLYNGLKAELQRLKSPKSALSSAIHCASARTKINHS